MVRGKIQGEVWGEQLEHEIEECDVVVAFGLRDLKDKMDVQVKALGYGLTNRAFISAIANCVVLLVLDRADSPMEEKDLLRLLADEINRLTRKSGPSVDELLEMIFEEVED